MAMAEAQGESVKLQSLTSEADEDRESTSEMAESTLLVDPSGINEGKISWRYLCTNTVVVS